MQASSLRLSFRRQSTVTSLRKSSGSSGLIQTSTVGLQAKNRECPHNLSPFGNNSYKQHNQTRQQHDKEATSSSVDAFEPVDAFERPGSVRKSSSSFESSSSAVQRDKQRDNGRQRRSSSSIHFKQQSTLSGMVTEASVPMGSLREQQDESSVDAFEPSLWIDEAFESSVRTFEASDVGVRSVRCRRSKRPMSSFVSLIENRGESSVGRAKPWLQQTMGESPSVRRGG
jgi:hypothetical protein